MGEAGRAAPLAEILGMGVAIKNPLPETAAGTKVGKEFLK
jgi:hypothetical protein